MQRTDYKQMDRIRQLEVKPNDAYATGESVVPFYTDDTKKAKYLSFRVNCFSVAESCKLADVHIKTVRIWRNKDPQFYKVDVEQMEGLRQRLSSQSLDIEFTRNFRLIMQKDFHVIMKALDNAPMTKLDEDYFLKLRNHYTPQQLAMIKQLLGGGTVDKPFDFTKFVMTIKRESESMEIKVE